MNDNYSDERIQEEKVLRLQFVRSGPPVWLAHLDVMHAFERGLRRAGIELKYTQGYNPRPRLVFALPLGVGVEATAEIVDVYLAEEVSEEGLIGRLSECLPIGLTIRAARLIDATEAKHLMADVAAAIYLLEVKGLSDALTTFHYASELIVPKFSKGRTRDTDIKPLILATEYLPKRSSNDRDAVRFLVKAGSHSNLRPDLILDAALEMGFITPHAQEDAVIHREALFLRDHKQNLDQGGVRLFDPYSLDPLDELPFELDRWDEANRFLAPELLRTSSDVE